jgi:glycosyltransferase involved in cell wall biosynthesis
MNDFLIRWLASVNRLLNCWLGGASTGAQPPKRTPFYLDRATGPACISNVYRRDTLVFVLEYCSRGAGGLADVLRLGAELERQRKLAVYYTAIGGQDEETCWNNIRWTHPGIRREQVVSSFDFDPEFLCATAWPTAYHVWDRPSRRKLYFVQDYEPYFYRAGVESCYAARSYELGLEMFTLGPWLAGHLEAVHRVRCAGSMPFPVSDPAEPGRPPAERPLITFYVQPDKPQRGSEILLESMRRLSERIRRDRLPVELALFGSAENEKLALDFPCRRQGVLADAELAALFRETRLGVCASLTNVSLVTFRFLAFGCTTLDVDDPRIRTNLPSYVSPLIRFYRPEPDALRDAVLAALAAPPAEPARGEAVRRLVREHSWEAGARALLPVFV